MCVLQEFYAEDMKRRWKSMFAMGTDLDWDMASELPPISPEQRGKNTRYTPLQAWHGVDVPDEVLTRGSKHAMTSADRQKHHVMTSLDHNAVVVTVQSGDAVQTHVDSTQQQHLDKSDLKRQLKSHAYKSHGGRVLPPLPAYTQTADSEADIRHTGMLPISTSSVK